MFRGGFLINTNAALLMLFVLFPSHAYAAIDDVCVPSGSSIVTVPLPGSVIVQQDLPLGGIIASVEVQTTMRCSNNYYPTGGTAYYYKSSGNRGVGVSAGAFRTDIEGVGLKWTISGDVSGTHQFSNSALNDASVRIGFGFPFWGGEKVYTLKHRFEIVKTASVTGGSFKFPDFLIRTSPSSVLGGSYEKNLNSFTFPEVKVTPVTCKLLKDNISVSMGTSNVKNFYGIGTTTKEKSFSIDLSCDAGTRVNLTLDNTDQISGYPGTIKLSATPKPAAGVGIQVLMDSPAGYVPATLGEMQLIGTAEGGAYSIDMAARYIQTEQQISPGQADGALTFVLKYL